MYVYMCTHVPRIKAELLCCFVTWAQDAYWQNIGRPADTYLKDELETLSDGRQVHILDSDVFLQSKAHDIVMNFPIPVVPELFQEGAVAALDSNTTSDTFKPHRFPKLVEKVKENLKKHQASLDTSMARRKILAILEEAVDLKRLSCCWDYGLSCRLPETGMVELHFDTDKIRRKFHILYFFWEIQIFFVFEKCPSFAHFFCISSF